MAELSDATREILSPVWAELDGDDIVFNTAEGRVKAKNLRRDPRIALSAIDPDNYYHAVLIRGRVTEITEEGADEHINLMAKKYMDVDEYPYHRPGEVRLRVRVEPEHEMVMG